MICEKCKNEHDGTYATGRFCSVKCSKSFSSSLKRIETNLKVSKTLTGSGNPGINKKCPICEKEFYVRWSKRNKKTCSRSCAIALNWTNKEYRENITNKKIIAANDPKEKERLKIIGRKGGFGNKGYTDSGIYYQSSLEKVCFEFLEFNNIKFEPHKNIPNSSKVSDIYIIHLDLWIELDGIDREKRKKWLGKNYQYWLEKLETYKKEKLKFKIIKTFEDFKIIIANVCTGS